MICVVSVQQAVFVSCFLDLHEYYLSDLIAVITHSDLQSFSGRYVFFFATGFYIFAFSPNTMQCGVL